MSWASFITLFMQPCNYYCLFLGKLYSFQMYRKTNWPACIIKPCTYNNHRCFLFFCLPKLISIFTLGLSVHVTTWPWHFCNIYLHIFSLTNYFSNEYAFFWPVKHESNVNPAIRGSLYKDTKDQRSNSLNFFERLIFNKHIFWTSFPFFS